jgi:hypothetical protein
MATNTKPNKKPAKRANSKKNFTKRISQAEWLLIVGGSDTDRRDKAGRLQYEHLLKVTKQYNPTVQQIRMRTNNKPSTIDIAGYDKTMLRNLLLGNIEDLDISGNPYSWLSKTKGRLLNLYGLNGLVLNNINYSRHADTLELIVNILRMIKVSTEALLAPYGMFIITLQNDKDLEKIPDRFRDLFKIISLDGENAIKESVAEIAESKKFHEEEVEDKQGITLKLLFTDDKKNILYFDKKKTVALKPEELKLIEYLRRQDAFELEQILTEHFMIKLRGTGRTIYKEERTIFDTYKSNINKKCQPLGIGDLIVKHGDIKKAFKLSVGITKKTLQL